MAAMTIPPDANVEKAGQQNRSPEKRESADRARKGILP
jgi:hypothetical protein